MYPLPQRQLRSRTINTVANDLNNLSVSSDKPTSSHFLNCRYDPFSTTPVKTYIPDGKGRNVVVRDIKFAHNIVVADKEQMNIEIAPCLPYPVAFATETFMNASVLPTSTVDGFVFGGVSTGGPTNTESQYLRTVFPNIMQQNLTYGDLGETNNIMGARITTIGYRLIYTGAASAAQGVIIATDHNWNLEAYIPANINAADQWVSASTLAPASKDALIPNSYPEFNCGLMTMTNTQNVTSQTLVRPENGLRGILKYQLPAEAHEFKPWIEGGAIVTRPNTQGGTSNVNMYVRSGPVFTGGFIRQQLMDPALMMSQIKITSGGSYRLEVAICYEQDLSLNHKFIDMARQSPMIDRALLDVDSSLNSTVHPAGLAQPIVDIGMQTLRSSFRRPNAPPPGRGRKRTNQRRRRNKKVSRPAPKKKLCDKQKRVAKHITIST